MVLFVVIALLATAATVGLLLLPLVRAQGSEVSRAARDAAVYRDQLAEIERDVARGTISAAEAAGTRAEISRRLIAASARAEAEGADTRVPTEPHLSPLAIGALAAVPVATVLVYLAVGSPSLPDRPFAERPIEEQRAAVAGIPGAPRMSQAEAEASAGIVPPEPLTQEERTYADQVAQLETVLASRPDDVRGRSILASSYMRQQRFSEAVVVYRELGKLLGPRADAQLFADKAEAMVLAAGGYVSPEAEEAIRTSLTIDQTNPMGRYYAGLALAQRGETERAIFLWERLRAEATEEDAWGPLVDDMLARVRAASGRPPGARGPTAADIAAAEGMAPEEQQAMIRAMVEGLETRLTEEGGAPEEWVRLIQAYAVLEETDEARRVYALSQQSLSGSEAGFVREQALVMGVIAE